MILPSQRSCFAILSIFSWAGAGCPNKADVGKTITHTKSSMSRFFTMGSLLLGGKLWCLAENNRPRQRKEQAVTGYSVVIGTVWFQLEGNSVKPNEPKWGSSRLPQQFSPLVRSWVRNAAIRYARAVRTCVRCICG